MSERRIFEASEVRAKAKTRTIAGRAARYNNPAKINSPHGEFIEVLARGAFRSALQRGDDAACLFNHDANPILGRVSAGTLRMSEDDNGLNFECDLPGSAEDILESIERGDVRNMSFSFGETDEDWDKIQETDPEDRGRKTYRRRTIRNIKQLFDVSPVVYPAYSNTSVSARCENHSEIFIPEIVVAEPKASADTVARRRELFLTL
ncbi:MAG: HK97 family phage prohead protease [Acidobacteriota bacterium]|nr:HK97 family phage prohead protease [Acidobacteriota bacterium]